MISIQFLAAIILISLGLSVAVFKKNLIKIVMAVHVIGSGVNLFLVSLGYRAGGIAPIFTDASKLQMVLPTTQALTLTSIVIDFAVVALMLSFVISIYGHYGTLDTQKRRLKE
ncbi:MAG: cation:proton antiporter [Candidatus Makaraimicrobium thalassicum]|nr:MAG: cation:proton antiporter [Candidatus Omnitrophota bacterium]